jgi:hypothetical protein
LVIFIQPDISWRVKLGRVSFEFDTEISQ